MAPLDSAPTDEHPPTPLSLACNAVRRVNADELDPAETVAYAKAYALHALAATISEQTDEVTYEVDRIAGERGPTRELRAIDLAF
ncbi:hypothetical protein [Mycobacterium spongiae]|uniref:Uncharacterized protein n=1 Tax=Mycobacterium spongiae TaxID=886343 RepID=A0A975JYP4_9MYCO|nr:hypothetical protein [Mycobacterium spongiae]QUR68147.1 hypothetical protein F6B93_14575 [Mycobacterium spongiae]